MIICIKWCLCNIPTFMTTVGGRCYSYPWFINTLTEKLVVVRLGLTFWKSDNRVCIYEWHYNPSLHFTYFFVLFCFLAALCCLRNLSSLTRDWTWALGSESAESQPLDRQGIPYNSLICLYQSVIHHECLSPTLIRPSVPS